jgi:hypothetical protein
MPADQPKQAQPRSKIGTDVHLVLQQRDLVLLKTLALLRIVDREQARMICGFGSLTRVNARLLKLRRAGLLKRFFFVSAEGGKRAIYCLTNRSAILIGSPHNAIQRPADSFLLGDKFVAHQLALNQVYCACLLKEPLPDGIAVRSWRTFRKPLSPSHSLIPDAYFEIHSIESVRPMFLEVDLGTEGLTVWNKKIEQYVRFAASGEFARLFHSNRFSVLVVATTEGRLQSLRACIRKITAKLFYLTMFEKIKEHGFWHSVWFRPEGEQTQSLI